jgi:NADPH:quinone reductase-like Zn-dependent oxidoreductase
MQRPPYRPRPVTLRSETTGPGAPDVRKVREAPNPEFGRWRNGVIRPQIARTFALDEAAAAHDYIQDRKNIGLALLVP